MSKTGRYIWGEDISDTLLEVGTAIYSFIENEIDNGPGWVVIPENPEDKRRWDIHVDVRLVRK